MRSPRMIHAAVALCAFLAASAAFAPRAFPADNAFYVNSKDLEICYEITATGPAKIKDVELWVTTDNGRNWQRAEGARKAEGEDGVPYFAYTVKDDGTYGFDTVAKDEASNSEAPPGEPETVIVVDTKSPALKLLKPEKGGIKLRTGDQLELQWECRDQNIGGRPVRIEVSTDSGKNWATALAKGPAAGTHMLPLKSEGACHMLVRLCAEDLAGNKSVAELEDGVLVTREDNQSGPFPPSVSPSRTFDVEYEIENVGPSGLMAVLLWYSADEGKSWTFYGRDEDLVSPMTFEAPGDGVFWFYLSALNKPGIPSKPDPVSGTQADAMTLVDTAAPVVGILKPAMAEAWSGGSTQTIQWMAKDAHLVEKSISIFYSSDDGKTWQPVQDAQNIENTGTFTWAAPLINTTQLRIKVTAKDAGGNEGFAVSQEPVTIDSEKIHIDKISVRPRPGGRSQPNYPVGNTPVPPKKDAEVAKKHYQNATVLRAQGKLDDAIAQFEAAVAADKHFAEAWNDLGVVYFQKNRLQEAMGAFGKASEASPGDPEIACNLAKCCTATKSYDAAVENARRALGLTSSASPIAAEVADTLWALANQAARDGNRIAARTACEAIISIDSPDSRWEKQAKSLLDGLK
jgi:hypothetical protein